MIPAVGLAAGVAVQGRETRHSLATGAGSYTERDRISSARPGAFSERGFEMDTNYIRDLLRMGAQTWTEMAVDCIIDALDELDERTRPGGAPEPGPDTCDPLGPDTDTAPASTIPGCYCRECKHAQFVDEGKYWTCGLRGSPAYAVVSVPVGFGCVYGERREAE